MKKWKPAIVIIGAVAVAAAATGAYRVARMLSVGAAYKAKTLCSGVFIAHRNFSSITDYELPSDTLNIMRHVQATVDYDAREVTATFLGLIKRKAKFIPGLGCSVCYDRVQSSPGFAETLPSPVLPTAMPEQHDPRLLPVLDWAFSEPFPARPRRTRAVVVLQKGKIVAERYAPGFDTDTPLHGWSMTKTVINALIGILIKEGKISLDEPVPVPEWREPGDRRGTITLEHLLHMSSGLRFNEDYGNPLQDVTKMLFAVPDAAAYAAGKPLDAEPGTKWSYSSGTTNIISRVMREILGDPLYHQFPRRELFDRIGMRSAVIEADASGTFVGSSFMYATARDWARLGQLYLQDGVWEGVRILPEGWVKFSTTPAPLAPEKDYGAHIWLKIAGDFSSGDPGCGMPEDAYHAAGYEGQFVTVIPSRQLVIVRLGLTTYPLAWQHDRFIERVVDAMER